MKSAVVFAVAGLASGQNVHPDRAAMIKEIENTPGVLWKASPQPRFASEGPGASKNLCGVIGDQKANIDELVAKGHVERLSFDASAEIPESFDSEKNWPQCAKIINDIRDQSACGCCWAFAGAEAASDRMCIATNASMMVPLSAQDVCFNAGGILSHGCSGGQISSPWSFLKKGGFFGGKGAVSGGQYQGSGPFGKGLCSDFSMPHCHHHGPQGKDPYPGEGSKGCPQQSSPWGPKKCDADAVAPHNDFAKDKYSYTGSTVTASGIPGIQQAIMAGGPMEVAFTVYADFENYASGVYHHVSGGQVGGHAVKVVGWGVDSGVNYWKIANSWNPYWGEDGYFRIKFGEGGIADAAMGSSPSAKWSRAGDAAELASSGTCSFKKKDSCYLLRLQKCDSSSPWTLHGLWPQWQEKCHGASFDVSALSAIKSKMDSEWLSCPGHEGNEDFWKHEWETHGTCSGMKEVDFFTKALALHDHYSSKCGSGNECSVCFSKDLSSVVDCADDSTSEIVV